MTPVVVLEGEVFSELSLSRVNRELARALLRRGDVELGINAPLAGPYLGDARPEFAAVRARVGATLSREPDLFVRHRWPPDWSRPAHGRYAHVQPWEYGELPVAWAEAAAAADEIWCYSRYVREIYARAGVDPARLRPFPLGVDPELFRPDGPRRDLPVRGRFRFLFLGGTIWRKGAELAVNAYLQAFGPADDVCLIVKDVGVRSSYRGQTAHAQIAALQGRSDLAEILYLDETYDDAELAALYRSADVILHPYRGEGFGLPVLEAMACGTPAIVTAGGATDDFVDATVGVPVAAERVAISLAEATVAPPWGLDIPAPRLAAVLRAVAARPEAVAGLARAAAERVRTNWTWDATAALVAARALT